MTTWRTASGISVTQNQSKVCFPHPPEQIAPPVVGVGCMVRWCGCGDGVGTPSPSCLPGDDGLAVRRRPEVLGRRRDAPVEGRDVRVEIADASGSGSGDCLILPRTKHKIRDHKILHGPYWTTDCRVKLKNQQNHRV